MTTTNMSKSFVIFSGYNNRAIVSFCRQLKLLKQEFSIIASSMDDPIFKTAYRKQVRAVRSSKALDSFDLERCLNEVRAFRPRKELVVCPSSEFLNHHLLENRSWFEARGCTIPLVEKDLYAKITNKRSFRDLCAGHGLDVPRSLALNEFQFPFVAKPILNITASGKSLYPIIFRQQSDWERHGSLIENEDDYYYEEFIDGLSYYLLFYFPVNTGYPVHIFSQRNILQQAQGKSMLMAISTELHRNAIADQLTSMLRGIGFHGLAMIELIKRGSRYYMIELNPRLWGPMQLLLNAGSDILSAFIQESTTGRIESTDPLGGRLAGYLWFGGQQKEMVWHTARPLIPQIDILAHLVEDVYCRPDTIRLFFHELLTAHK
jgi:hypothetical protein